MRKWFFLLLTIGALFAFAHTVAQIQDSPTHRRKSILVVADQITERWFSEQFLRENTIHPLPGVTVDAVQRRVFLQTVENGTVYVRVGDWIVDDPYTRRKTAMADHVFVALHDSVH